MVQSTMKTIRSNGFGLIEIIIALAIATLLSGIGYATYQEHITTTNRVKAIHDMINIMTDFEKFYSQNGSYADSQGNAPKAILIKLAELTKINPYYNFTCQPQSMCSKKNSNLHNVSALFQGVGVPVACIVAIPKDNSFLIANRYLMVDNHGDVITSLVAPIDCIVNE